SGGGPGTQLTYIKRKINVYEVLNEEGLALIEKNTDTVLEEIGIIFRDDAEALQLWKEAGADVKGERVHFPKGLCRSLLKTAPSIYTQHARNSERSVQIGGNATVFAPVYGPPFVRDLDGVRRYATIEDFQNFVKLAYMAPSIHHSGGTVCEPVDVPVNKRHLDMVYAHIKYSDKPFMGSVTAPERAEDTVAMAKLVFGDDFVENNTVLTSLINANSPMVFDETMLGALKVYSRHNQACIVTPFILAGAMSPVTVAGTLTQVLAEVLAGASFTQLIRPGAPVLFGTFASSISMQSGAPTFGTPEPSLVSYGAAQLARRLGLPFRTGGSLCASKVPDAQAAYESANTLNSTILAGTNFVLHSAGWLEGGLRCSYEKTILDIDLLQMVAEFLTPLDLSEDALGFDAIQSVGPGGHFFGTQHTQDRYKTAFYSPILSDWRNFESWTEAGSPTALEKANRVWKERLASYEEPYMSGGAPKHDSISSNTDLSS
ncbi:MAG: trimethylamine methyltransferase, partial [Mesorhizobium sp.]